MLFKSTLSDKKTLLSTVVIIISLAASFATCYFATPTVFGGRDQGAIATAMIDLVKYKSFSFSTPISHDLFQKYGPGKALNYPGFDYTRDGQLTSRFPKAYITYLAFFYRLFGLPGIQYANFVPLFLFLFLFWLTLRHFFSDSISFLGFLLAVTFFPFLWFAKFSLTEIFMLFFVWAGIYFFLSYLKNPDKEKFLYFSFSAFALSALTRIEGIVFFLLALAYILLIEKKKALNLPKNFRKNIVISTGLLLVLYIFLGFTTLLDSVKNIIKAILPSGSNGSGSTGDLYSHLAKIFFSYNIAPYILLGLAGIIWLIWKFKKNWTKPEFAIVAILFPSFFYLVSPMITLDDPWLLRRFVFAVFPVLLFFSIYCLNRFFLHKTFLYLSLIVLVTTNAVVSWRFLKYSENKDLLPQITQISQKFGPNDLILVDRLATGSGFSLISEPLASLYGKNAIYFFNAEDLRYIDRSRYQNIYLVTPADDNNHWYSQIEKSPAGFSVITNNFLEPSTESFRLAVNTEYKGAIIFWKLK